MNLWIFIMDKTISKVVNCDPPDFRLSSFLTWVWLQIVEDKLNQIPHVFSFMHLSPPPLHSHVPHNVLKTDFRVKDHFYHNLWFTTWPPQFTFFYNLSLYSFSFLILNWGFFFHIDPLEIFANSVFTLVSLYFFWPLKSFKLGQKPTPC